MALKKLNKEMKALEGELPEGCTCGPKGDDMMNWQGKHLQACCHHYAVVDVFSSPEGAREHSCPRFFCAKPMPTLNSTELNAPPLPCHVVIFESRML